MTSVHFLDAIKKLIDATDRGSLSPNAHREFLAVLSHWIHNSEANPIYGDANLRTRWVRLLADGIGAENPTKTTAPKFRFREENKFGHESDVPFLPKKNPTFTFVDLFAGIGGFRLALQRQGGKCVFSCEADDSARTTYFRNFGEYPFGDIRRITRAGNRNAPSKIIDAVIPDHDVLAAGFPCQPFSRAGVSARTSMSRSHGFDCEDQGTLFFDLLAIIRVKKPRALFLENVQNIVRHDNGRTFERIEKEITDLGYSFSAAIINSSRVVPQKRKRCYIVCLAGTEEKFKFPNCFEDGDELPLKSILERHPAASYTISDRLWVGHINRTSRNKARGVGFTANPVDVNAPSPTLVARYGKDGKECLIPQQSGNPRMLTPLECARLQGFPDGFRVAPTKTRAYKELGNAVCVPVAAIIARDLIKVLATV